MWLVRRLKTFLSKLTKNSKICNVCPFVVNLQTYNIIYYQTITAVKTSCIFKNPQVIPVFNRKHILIFDV